MRRPKCSEQPRSDRAYYQSFVDKQEQTTIFELTGPESTTQEQLYLRVALPVPLRDLFEYLCPVHAHAAPGHRVRVPFGPRTMIGVIIEVARRAHNPELQHREIDEILDDEPCLNTELLHLCQWASDYYLFPLGEAVATALPPYLRRDDSRPVASHWVLSCEGKGLPLGALKSARQQQAILDYLHEYGRLSEAELQQQGLKRAALRSLAAKGLIEASSDLASTASNTQILRETPLPLNEEQQQALEQIRLYRFACHLLHGVTGSGKTEVYLQLAASALQIGKQVLVLIPEIGLSAQTVLRFKRRFAVAIVELHSGISDVERSSNWIAAQNGSASIVIGTRLAAFAPLRQLGLIIVDEEHDTAYKQLEGLRYSARDLSIYRASQLGIPIVLGSATPALETFNHALNGRYQHLILRRRAATQHIPDLSIVDLRAETLVAGLSSTSMNALGTTVAQGNQALVFLNRRGYSPSMLCHACGWLSQCTRCSSTMTLHHHPRRLHCHHCDRRARAPERCPNCGYGDLDNRGNGTEQIEYALRQALPDYPCIRVDADSAASKRAFDKALAPVHNGEPCILVGTQMLAKGHHFPKLQLVIIVDADQGFVNPDFRALEKMGQLIQQVSGRAGREQSGGKVLVQTHRPEHPLLVQLVERGYARFARALLQERYAAQMPPFSHCALFRAESKRAENAQSLLQLITALQKKHFPPDPAVQIIGPVASAMEKVQHRYRFQLLVKCSERRKLKHILSTLITALEKEALSKRVKWTLDIDPVETA